MLHFQIEIGKDTAETKKEKDSKEDVIKEDTANGYTYNNPAFQQIYWTEHINEHIIIIRWNEDIMHVVLDEINLVVWNLSFL